MSLIRRAGPASFAEWLSYAAAQDPGPFDPALESAADNIERSGLDARTHALVRLAALVAAGEPGTRYELHVEAALDHGVTFDELVGMLVALLPMVGTPRVTAAARALLETVRRGAADNAATPRPTSPGPPARVPDTR